MRPALASIALAAFSLLLAGCGSDGSSGPTAKIQLTQAQAALLVGRVSQIAPIHAELAWLADSIALVVKPGAEVDRVDIVTNLATGPFLAVGLQRAVTATPNSFSTFHLIAFNDAADPTDFIIVGGYRQGSTGTPPPQSVNGSFGQPAPGLQVSGHLFHVSGSTISAWRAETGTATLATGSTGDPCPGFLPVSGVTCAQSTLQASFAIQVARHDGGVEPTDTRNASLASATVTGILLRFQERSTLTTAASARTRVASDAPRASPSSCVARRVRALRCA